MKKLYTSPVVKVEELARIDVLCASSEVNTNENADPDTDNLTQDIGTLGDFSRFLG